VSPVRLRLSRRKGFRLQNLSRQTNGLPAVNVARPSVFGNPFSISNVLALRSAGGEKAAHDMAIAYFRNWLSGRPIPAALKLDGLDAKREAILTRADEELNGKNLACWCGPGETCHADVLLGLASERRAVSIASRRTHRARSR